AAAEEPGEIVEDAAVVPPAGEAVVERGGSVGGGGVAGERGDDRGQRGGDSALRGLRIGADLVRDLSERGPAQLLEQHSDHGRHLDLLADPRPRARAGKEGYSRPGAATRRNGSAGSSSEALHQAAALVLPEVEAAALLAALEDDLERHAAAVGLALIPDGSRVFLLALARGAALAHVAALDVETAALVEGHRLVDA